MDYSPRALCNLVSGLDWKRAIAPILLTRPRRLCSSEHGPGSDSLCVVVVSPLLYLGHFSPELSSRVKHFHGFPRAFNLAGCNVALYLFLSFDFN